MLETYAQCFSTVPGPAILAAQNRPVVVDQADIIDGVQFKAKYGACLTAKNALVLLKLSE